MTNRIERYQWTLSDEDLAVVVGELNEPDDNDERLLRIDNLRKAFKKNKQLRLIRSDDYFLLRFLRAAKFHHHRAIILLYNYHTKFQTCPEVFEKIKNPQLIKHVFDAGCYVPIKGKANDGSVVCIGRPGKVANALVVDYIAANLLTYQRLLDDERVQIYGITIFEDMSYFGFNMFKQILFSVIKLRHYVGLHQSVLPLRLRRICFVNVPSPLSLFITVVIRPFLSDKMKRRVCIYSKNFTELEEFFDPANFPPAYGGTGDPIDGDVANSWRDSICGISA